MSRVTEVEQLGEAIRLARKRRGLTQQELADVCGVGINFISNIERGKGSAEIGKVLHVVEMLGLVVVVEDRATWNRISRYIELDEENRSS